MTMLDPLFGWEVTDRIFSDSVRVQRMLDFERAVAAAEARLSVIPKNAGPAISNHCKVELFDLQAIAQAAAAAGNLAIPLVKELTKLVAQSDEEASRFVHWGATSQDVIDTGLILQLRDAFDAIESELQKLSEKLGQLAKSHRTTALPARTWLQHAVPTVFGLKVAGWLDALTRHRERLRETRQRVVVLQFGGAAGTLASLGSDGMKVAQVLAEELGLSLPSVPWHSHRDRIAEVGTTLALMVGTLGKIARDLSLQNQTEVAEAFESAADGRGGSSTMPQKRNPIACSVILAAANQMPALASALLTAMPQEHERGLGGWQAEWNILPEVVRQAGGALHHATDLISSLQIDSARMLQNLDATQGLIFAEAVASALGKHIGKQAAHQLVEECCRRAIADKKHLREILSGTAEIKSRLTPAELDNLFQPLKYLGVADEFIDRTIAASKAEKR
jgi:3-carboxy-cis,cis-muconate cycloisomerase